MSLFFSFTFFLVSFSLSEPDPLSSEPEPEPEEERPRKNKPLTPQERLQAIWDANGAMIYAANQQFKAKFGKEMDSETKKKAIKDATQNGVFQANKYASNLETTRQQENKKTSFELSSST